jgi:hypothetical protein
MSCVGSGERSATLPLQSLSADVQRLDENAVGEFAHEGQMGGADRGPDRGGQHRESGVARRRALHDGVSLATPVSSGLAGDKPKALAGIVEGDETFILESFKGKRSGMARKCRKRGDKSAKRGLSTEQIPVIVARDRQCADHECGAAEIEPCPLPRPWAGSSRPPTNSAVMAARDCCLRAPGGDCSPHPADAEEAKAKRHRIFTSTTSTPTTSAEGMAAPLSMASPPKSRRTISAGAEPLRRRDRTPPRPP